MFSDKEYAAVNEQLPNPIGTLPRAQLSEDRREVYSGVAREEGRERGDKGMKNTLSHPVFAVLSALHAAGAWPATPVDATETHALSRDRGDYI